MGVLISCVYVCAHLNGTEVLLIKTAEKLGKKSQSDRQILQMGGGPITHWKGVTFKYNFDIQNDVQVIQSDLFIP